MSKDKKLRLIIDDIEDQKILDFLSDGVSIQSTDYKILYQNKASREIVGGCVGKLCYEVYADSDRRCEDCPLAMVFKEGGTHITERTLRKKDKTFYYEVKASPLRDSKGEIVGGIEIARDITEHKEMEKALKEEVYRSKKYFDIAEVILLVIGSDQKIKLINKRGCEILECKDEELIGKNWFDTFIPEKNRDEVRGIFGKLMAGEVDITKHFINPVLTCKGIEKIISWHNTILTDKEGNISGTLSSGEDVTTYRQMEGELKVRINELESFYNMALGRELKMKELKDQIEKLKSELSRYNN